MSASLLHLLKLSAGTNGRTECVTCASHLIGEAHLRVRGRVDRERFQGEQCRIYFLSMPITPALFVKHGALPSLRPHARFRAAWLEQGRTIELAELEPPHLLQCATWQYDRSTISGHDRSCWKF
jgi:hypothetical protein